MRRLAIHTALCLCLAGCYAAPGDLGDEEVLRIRLAKAGGVAADGASFLGFSLLFPGGTTAGHKISLTTTHGVLDPAGTTDAARKTRDVYTSGGHELALKLQAGRVPGAGVITAVVGTSLQVQQTFKLTRALPDQMAITPSPGNTLTSTTTRIDVSVTLARRDQQGHVSAGTRVHFLTCCTSSGTAKACDTRLLVPAFVDATASAPDSVKASVLLAAGGLSLVKQAGGAAADATLHALVLQPNKSGPTCATLSGTTSPASLAEVAAGASLQLTLQPAASSTK